MTIKTLEKPLVKKPNHSPRYRVLLHNDDKLNAEFVVKTLMEVCQLSETQSIQITMTAHNNGVSLIKVCDVEMAEFYVDTLKSRGVTSSMEPEV